MHESARETCNNESLADDNTTLTLVDLASLRQVKHILDSFGAISGLKCNFDKSVIMPVFEPDDKALTTIANVGFLCVNEITLLGVVIKNDLSTVV